MQDKRDNPVALALYHAAVGKIVLGYVEQIDSEAIERAMERRAVQTLEAMRRILEDERYTDPECFEIIDALVMQFFKELEIKVERHSEYD